MALSGYDVAQICLNGHATNKYTVARPQHNQNFCNKCGERTITKCPGCNQFIRGYYHVPGILGGGGRYAVPSFCHECGKPYPWTEKGLVVAREIISGAEGLKTEEKESLNKSVGDLVVDTPRTQAAALRFKQLLPKVGRGVADALQKILVDIASEAAKKALYP